MCARSECTVSQCHVLGFVLNVFDQLQPPGAAIPSRQGLFVHACRCLSWTTSSTNAFAARRSLWLDQRLVISQPAQPTTRFDQNRPRDTAIANRQRARRAWLLLLTETQPRSREPISRKRAKRGFLTLVFNFSATSVLFCMPFSVRRQR